MQQIAIVKEIVTNLLLIRTEGINVQFFKIYYIQFFVLQIISAFCYNYY